MNTFLCVYLWKYKCLTHLFINWKYLEAGECRRDLSELLNACMTEALFIQYVVSLGHCTSAVA